MAARPSIQPDLVLCEALGDGDRRLCMQLILRQRAAKRVVDWQNQSRVALSPYNSRDLLQIHTESLSRRKRVLQYLITAMLTGAVHVARNTRLSLALFASAIVPLSTTDMHNDKHSRFFNTRVNQHVIDWSE